VKGCVTAAAQPRLLICRATASSQFHIQTQKHVHVLFSQEDLCYGWNGDVASAVPSELSKADFDKIVDSETAAKTNTNFYKKERCSENRR
jgi:hypothetical protein